MMKLRTFTGWIVKLLSIFSADDKDCIYFSFFDYRKKKNEIKNVAG